MILINGLFSPSLLILNELLLENGQTENKQAITICETTLFVIEYCFRKCDLKSIVCLD